MAKAEVREQETFHLEEKELLRAVASGDKEAFRLLIEKYQSLVAATVIGMLGPGPTAEDIGQEAFVRLYTAVSRFRGEASVGTYVTRIAMNLCLNELRRRKRRALFGIRLSAAGAASTLDGQAEAESLDFHAKVRQAVMRLKPEFRAVVVLCWMDGHTSQEAAQILGLPIGTILSRLHRARQKLRSWLAPGKEEENRG